MEVLNMDPELKFEPVPDYGSFMTLRDFKDHVRSGLFVDDDGTGVLATPSMMSNGKIYPSDILRGSRFDPIFTHVVWFEK